MARKAKKNVRIPPSIDLAEFAHEHLTYEASMFLGARRALLEVPEPSFERNALIEVCVLHFRNLVDFLYADSPRPDDVVAADYIDDWDTRRPLPLSESLKQHRDRANKEMAHLTRQRHSGDVPQKYWDFEALSSELRPILRAFTELVDSGKITPRVLKYLQAI